MQNFTELYETINALLIVRSKMLQFSENNQNIEMFGVPPNTYPQVTCMYMMIICHWAILHYNMSFKTIAGRSDGVFLMISCRLSEDQEKIC